MTREQLIENHNKRVKAQKKEGKEPRQPITYFLWGLVMIGAIAVAVSTIVPAWAEFSDHPAYYDWFPKGAPPSTFNLTIIDSDGNKSQKSYTIGSDGPEESAELIIEPQERSEVFEVTTGDVVLFVDIAENIEMEGYTILLKHPEDNSFSSVIVSDEEFVENKELFDSLQHGDSISWDDERNFTLVKKSVTHETFDELERELKKLKKLREKQYRSQGSMTA